MIEGGRAVAVEFEHGGKIERADACTEILLAAGAINSPQLLMLSGVGPAAELARHGIALKLDAPGVGANLQDHLDACTIFKSPSGLTYDHTNDLLIGLWQVWMGLCVSQIAVMLSTPLRPSDNMSSY